MRNVTLHSLICALFVLSANSESSEETVFSPNKLVPVAIAESCLAGRGLSLGDPSEIDEEVAREGGARPFRVHSFHTGKISVAVFESEPGKVRINGLPYDEFVQILEGRLILMTDDGEVFEFEEGDSLVVPKGFVGYWHMPEKYRELIVINVDYVDTGQDDP